MSDRVTEQEITEVLAYLEGGPVEVEITLKRLVDERDALEAELDEVRLDRDELEDELANLDTPAFNVLRAVREWFDNVILHKRPMSDPQVIWKQVERVLEQ